MKMRIKNSTGYFLFAVALSVMMISGCSLFYPKPTSDPLAGWKLCQSQDPKDLDQAIRDDYQDYIQKLSPKERKFAEYNNDFEDGMGQHAVEIIIGINGRYWRHILIYDKDNKRIRTIKYATGYYAS